MKTTFWILTVSTEEDGTNYFLFHGTEKEAERELDDLRKAKDATEAYVLLEELTPEFLQQEYNCLAELSTV